MGGNLSQEVEEVEAVGGASAVTPDQDGDFGSLGDVPGEVKGVAVEGGVGGVIGGGERAVAGRLVVIRWLVECC